MTRWITGCPIACKNLPNTPSVYCLIINNRTVYVGSTRRLKSRFYEHKIRYGYFKNIHFPWCDIPDTSTVILKYKKSLTYGDWVMDEMRLIKKLKPIFNVAHKNPRG
jgi:excinuclease UvrABC nuclease subunit